MKKIIVLLITILLCGCESTLKFTDTNEYIYISNNRDKVTKFVVETNTLLGKKCYDINKEDGLQILDNLKIEKETEELFTDSNMYYIVYFENGNKKSFEFNNGNLVYKGKTYKLNQYDVFVLSTDNEIECNSDKINHNLIKTNINDDYNLYYYEIDNAYININNEKTDLSDALLSEEINIEDIVSKLEYDVGFWDGGSAIYKNNNLFVDDLELLKCKTLDGNADIYIGKIGMGYKANFCMDDNHTFTRTYTINEVSEYKEQQYENGVPVSYGKSIKVILSQYDEKNEVIINNLWDELEINKTYEFEFIPYDSLLDDSIENIFKYTTIVSVKETDKIGIDQINDLIR